MLVAVCLVLAACGSDDTVDTSEPPPETMAQPTTTTKATTTTTTPASTTSVAAPDTIFGWLHSFEGTDAAVVLEVDEAEMLTGEAAVIAAREDGEIGEGEDLPNDFYIRDLEAPLVELVIAPDVVVSLQACYPDEGECVTVEPVDLDTWRVLLGSEDDPGLAWQWYGMGTLPYHFTVEDGVVTAIEEQYLP
jgi:hypothetical protein